MELVTQLANHSSDTFNQTFFVWAYFFSVYAYAVDLRFILFIIHTHTKRWILLGIQKSVGYREIFLCVLFMPEAQKLLCCQWPNQIDEFVMGL
jgi:hypothetical protein